ncbi:MAG: dehydrogenase [Desulfobulbaceae bacterium]|nr:MAG: dehydrogenase [Desulfobulbaceae bacterium]
MDTITRKQKLSDSYKLMAACFYEPEPALFTEEKVFQNLSRLITDLCPEAEINTEDMQQALQKDNDVDLQVAHAELFIGPFELKASPYGSTYLEQGRRLMGDTTMEVLKHYRKAGLEIDVEQPPDHIAIELEFVSHLYGLEAQALQDSDKEKASDLAQQRQIFIQTYVRPWMPAFINNVRSGTEHAFYRSLADCFEKFVRHMEGLEKPPAN